MPAPSIPATIVMPVNTPTVKVVNTRRHGAEVILHGETVEEAAAFAHKHGAEKRPHLHPPLRRPAGHRRAGHAALEMLGAAPEIDTLVVPIGGGGLISGIAVAAKALKPDIRVIGVQAALYPSMYNAIKGTRCRCAATRWPKASPSRRRAGSPRRSCASWSTTSCWSPSRRSSAR